MTYVFSLVVERDFSNLFFLGDRSIAGRYAIDGEIGEIDHDGQIKPCSRGWVCLYGWF